MTFDHLQQNPQLLLLDCISGSTAYNLNVKGSDTDKKGIFIMPQKQLYGFTQTDQVANNTNDEVYFEIRRFLELLTKNNPNILELLSTPSQFVLYRHPLMDLVKPEDFLSKLCLDTFAGYAHSQIKKARGLNKKINKPMDEERRSVLDFCYVIHNNGSIPLKDWLKENNFEQQACGLVNLDHFRDVYLLYHQKQLKAGYFRGITSGADADDVQLSPVPEGVEHLAVMNFNKDSYSVYCKEFKEYREWEAKRNEARYQSTLLHGKSYDAKNMMHTFRLLNMAGEIAQCGHVIVNRPDRDFLLKIRNGEFEFDALMNMVDEKMEQINETYRASTLPDKPDLQKAEDILLQIRAEFYHSNQF
ncbi:nucleotidyltransferase [Mucilaginibacter rubeus]|uniref:Nucleotidyltransferase n=1 Tax=Mucilaginibacter rubeus TaxID=2027860 RepID=A0AAE6MIZ9_9SPHI|nr:MULTISPECIES: nucleotidyltransferase domain-containing protein [Mucilaginibacter]QEM04672.1 nucleotidyltransferase [Mucilaginibacter rubeus]QEM17266.1 nucleotidyltransferase [Mucilaginibacter gossypii]QTE46225.1 nucleotidyltransferase domain-containing protein [Mucilaginibacter rubeus]QTE52822.1 nucleotidyltransferase domain-containing protein [Mucilaginibacter rubeus]QTE57909.1 nucleotidyltransferase domain-containing protein [Mucilaginibacter rubeus]